MATKAQRKESARKEELFAHTVMLQKQEKLRSILMNRKNSEASCYTAAHEFIHASDVYVAAYKAHNEIAHS